MKLVETYLTCGSIAETARRWHFREFIWDEECALFPPQVLDRISADWALRGGNDLLAHYKEFL